MLAGVAYGKSQRSVKDEDAFACQVAKQAACFGVFDSHGGKEAGRRCAAELAPNLLTLGGADDAVGHAAFPKDSIVTAFWDMDHDLGSHGVYSGTTASVLLVAPLVAPAGDALLEARSHAKLTENSAGADATAGGDMLCCTLAWVGDSTALTLEMGGSERTPEFWQTSNHTPTNPQEVHRCELEWRARQLLQAGALDAVGGGSHVDSFRLIADSGASFYARRQAPTQEQVVQAAQSLGVLMSEEETALLVRALRREKRIEAPERRQSFLTTGKPKLTRADTSMIARVSEVDPSVHGPTVLAAGERSSVSTCVTRSIGDWDASRAMVPHPDVHRFEVRGANWVRVIIASDGVWDFVTDREAATLARRCEKAQDAATKLVDLAYRRSMRRLERLKDDTTALVVDLNPSASPFQPPTATPGGCCMVM